MSEEDMNGDARFFMTLEARDKTLLRLAAAFAAATALSGCVSAPKAPPLSTVDAKRIAELQRANRSYPRWSRFPKAPQNVPTATDIAQRVTEAQQAQAELLASAAKIDWSLAYSGTPTADFAALARSAINPELAQPAPPDTAAQTAAFQKAMKDLATPPPPPAK